MILFTECIDLLLAHFLSFYHTFSTFTTLSNTFSHFLTLSHTFSNFLILSYTFPYFLNIWHSFCYYCYNIWDKFYTFAIFQISRKLVYFITSHHSLTHCSALPAAVMKQLLFCSCYWNNLKFWAMGCKESSTKISSQTPNIPSFCVLLRAYNGWSIETCF